MKILMKDQSGAHTGKGFFLQRLEKSFIKLGHTIVHSPKDTHEIYLDAINFKLKTAAPKVLRLDGVYFCKNRPYKAPNKVLKKSIKKADGVVWQSAFTQKQAHKVLKIVPKKEAVIWNGADPDEFNVEPAKSKYPKNMLLVAKWLTSKYERPHKRLKQMIKISEELCRRDPDLCVWIAGEHKRNPTHERIISLGKVSQPVLRSYYKLCDVMLNLCSHDSCPNTVVEALVAGVPVVSSFGGGTSELVEGYGVVLPLDPPWKYGIIKSDKPPKIVNIDMVYDTVQKLLAEKVRVKADHLYIDTIAQKYIDFFKEVLG